jgi:hypothetical protein
METLYGVSGFQQYLRYIVTVSFIGGGPGKSHWQTLPQNVVHLAIALIEIWTHNISGDRHIQLPYDHGHNGPLVDF